VQIPEDLKQHQVAVYRIRRVDPSCRTAGTIYVSRQDLHARWLSKQTAAVFQGFDVTLRVLTANISAVSDRRPREWTVELKSPPDTAGFKLRRAEAAWTSSAQ
jgi:hypothetical protein